jgi:MFS family permease
MRRFSGRERHLIVGMGLLTGIRTLGASMIMPVFSYYALHQAGATEQMVGIAIGIFGISQMLFQVPMGSLSDRWGRKRMTIFGSLIFIAGIVLCGLSRDVYMLTASRFIAGAGAVSGVAMTWITDGVGEERRNAAVACLGLCIGAAVIAGFPLSWAIAGAWGARNVFYATAFFSLVAVGYALFFIRDDGPAGAVQELSFSRIGRCLGELAGSPDMLRLVLSGFIGSACLSGVFYIMPLLIARETHIDHMWRIFAPAAVVGTALMFYFAKRADSCGTVRIAMIGFALELAGVALPVTSHSFRMLVVSLVLFYSGHCILSPLLPVAVSRYPEQGARGTVMSVFTMFQFLGTGVGGMAAGFLLWWSPSSLFPAFTVLILCAMVLISGFGNFSRVTAPWFGVD